MKQEEITELRDEDTEKKMALSWLYEAVCQLPYKIRKVVELYYPGGDENKGNRSNFTNFRCQCWKKTRARTKYVA